MPLIEQVLDRYPGSVKVVFKHFPLSFHKQALPAALASMAAAEQGRFWEYHDELFLKQNRLGSELYLEIAQGRPSLRQRVEQDVADGNKAGVTGTPAIFVNGRRVKQRDIETMSRLIDEELAAGKE